MLGRQHLFFGVSTATALAIAGSGNGIDIFNHPVIFIMSSAVGSLMPDIDTPTSTIGRMTWPISKLVNKIFGHRTYTHDFILWLIISIFACIKNPLIFGFFFGYIGHLFLDSLTAEGIPILYLFNKKKFHLLPYKMKFYANSKAASVVTYLMSALTIFIIWVFTDGKDETYSFFLRVLKTIGFPII